jgi:hypothetical protein
MLVDLPLGKDKYFPPSTGKRQLAESIAMYSGCGTISAGALFLKDRVNLLTLFGNDECKNGNKLPWSLEN